MSITCTVFVPEGIAMAADSRMTAVIAPREGAEGRPMMFSASDNAQKVFLLSKVQVGVSACGLAMIEGKTIADYLRLFEIEHITAKDTVSDVANKLAKYARGFADKLSFFVCGYHKDEPYAYTVGREVTRSNYKDGKIQYSISWAGEPTVIRKLLQTEPRMNMNLAVMPLKDAIDLSNFLIDTTIQYQRFEQKPSTCGGDVDILVLTKDDAFWYKHKLFAGK
ncbi:MAG: hypothetical protein Q4B99_05455 [Clostridia bacterium]|nr:hypothetical protein [Clostridia bacterium]